MIYALALATVAASGTVVDAQSGAPLSGIVVQQEGGLAVTLTGADGRFKLVLEPGARELTLSGVGHARKTVTAAEAMSIRLEPLTSYVVQAAPPATEPTEASHPLRGGLEFGYRLRRQALAVGSANVEGLANNDVRLGYRWRGGPWLLEGEGMHYQTPVNVPGLAREANPAFSPSTWQAGALAGAAWQPWPGLEAGLGAGYRYNVTTPNNGGIPYTASALDFEQTRHAAGGAGLAAWELGPVRLEGRLAYYPLVWASAKAPGSTFGGESLLDARLAGYYRLMPGLALGLTYGLERWQGSGSESGQLLGAVLHYAPDTPAP
jgi:hypothetical protein